MQSFKPYTINLHGRLLNINRPQVMGIINVTPDSFYGESRAANRHSVIKQAEDLIANGTDMIDIGIDYKESITYLQELGGEK